MGLFQKAVETYDNMEHLTGVESEAMKAALAPIGFITTGVQIAITVTENGEFVKAEHIFDIFPDSNGKSQKQMKKVIIPATEDSAGRSSTSAKTTPHPLCDKLMYMCPENKESYDAYLKQLQDWCASEFACPKVKAILEYVKKGTVRADVESVYEKEKAKEDDFVCWRVLSSDCSEPEEVWKSRSVIGGRGLKSVCVRLVMPIARRPPRRGTWIEILQYEEGYRYNAVVPRVGEFWLQGERFPDQLISNTIFDIIVLYKQN